MGGAFKIKLLVVVSVLILNAGFFVAQIKAQTEDTSNITVQATVPAAGDDDDDDDGGGGGGGGGGTLPPSNQAPVISNVSAVPTKTTAVISWTATDDAGVASASLVYGLTTSYGSTGVVGGSYSSSLSSLSGETTYYYKITVTDTGGLSTTNSGSFTTLAVDVLDITPPVISNISVSPLVTSARATFNTSESASVQVAYGLTSSLGSSASGGASGINHEVVLLGLSPNTKYYYKIIATDASLNSSESSVGNFTTASDFTPPPDVSGLSISVSGNSLVLNWTNPSVSDFSGVKILRKINSAPTGPNDPSAQQVYAGSGSSYADSSVAIGTTYFYTVYSFDTSGNYSPGAFVSGKISGVTVLAEICGNGSDDDGDGSVDCADSDCASSQQCKTPEVIGATKACNDGVDNDSDGLIDYPLDPGCTSADDTEEYNVPVVNVPTFARLDIDDLKFLSGNRQVQLFPQNGNVDGLSNTPITIGVPSEALAGLPKSVVLRIGDGETHNLTLNQADQTYYADVVIPQNLLQQTHLEVDYGGDQKDVVNFNLRGVGLGKVVADGNPVQGAEVVLFRIDGTKVDTGIYGQNNPITTGEDGLFGWVVPNGDYYLIVNKEGFFERRTGNFKIKNNIINLEVSLTARPPKLLENIDKNASLRTNALQLSKNLLGNSKAAVGLIGQAADNPTVEKTANIAAPAVASAVAVGAVALVSWADLLSLLQMIFLQPLLLFGRGKRDKWGLVYNSLSKMPIDLAIVRLINAETKKIVKTKVTGSDGKYVFVAEPGKYVLDVRKGDFTFPSELLKGFTTDGTKLDIYHGEEIVVSEKGVVITANIPMDPLGEYKTPRRLIISKFLRKIQHAVSWVGLFVIIISLYIAPKWYMWVLLAVNLFFMFIFRRLARPPVAKGWGIVYDAINKKPISKVVARLFDTKFNKLVATEVTGNDGRYFFMAGDNKYYISYEREGYEPNKTEVIDLSGKGAETIARDVKLDKKK